jgi:hypothetical protein
MITSSSQGRFAFASSRSDSDPTRLSEDSPPPSTLTNAATNTNRHTHSSSTIHRGPVTNATTTRPYRRPGGSTGIIASGLRLVREIVRNRTIRRDALRTGECCGIPCWIATSGRNPVATKVVSVGPFCPTRQRLAVRARQRLPMEVSWPWCSRATLSADARDLRDRRGTLCRCVEALPARRRTPGRRHPGPGRPCPRTRRGPLPASQRVALPTGRSDDGAAV